MPFALAALLASRCSNAPPGPTTPPPPTLAVTAVSPAIGSTTNRTTVILTGTNFAADATLAVGGIAAINVVVQSATTLTATLTARPTPGATDVVVTSGGRSAGLAGGFTFVAPSGANQPPVIGSMRSIGSRPNQPSGFADVNETITLVAAVTNAETPPGGLTYTWSGDGSISGAGSTVLWRAPSALPAPATPTTVTLTVEESFTEGAIAHTNTTSASFPVQLHDSQTEIGDMGEDFLTLFSRSEVGTSDVLHNFSTSCDGGGGRSAEKSDVDANRATYIEDFSKFRIQRNPPVTFNFGGRCPYRLRAADACASYTVHWEVNKRSNGTREITDGVDYVTAVLQNNRWLLCHSDFEGVSRNLTTGISQYVTW